MGYAKDVLVDTSWVEEHLADDSIRIVEVDEDPGLYAEAHTSPVRWGSTGGTIFRIR